MAISFAGGGLMADQGAGVVLDIEIADMKRL
jgi:hypothetical protein